MLERREELPSEISHVLFRREDGWIPSKAVRWLEARGFPAARLKTYEDLESRGGARLKPGSYIVFRRTPRTRGFTSYGYSDEIQNGVWFKFGGYRPRPRRAKESLREVTVPVSSVVTTFGQAATCGDVYRLIDYIGSEWEDEEAVVIYTNAEVRSMPLHRAAELLCGRSEAVAADHLGPSGRYFVAFRVNGEQQTSEPFTSAATAMRVAKNLDRIGIPVDDVFEQDEYGRRVSVR